MKLTMDWKKYENPMPTNHQFFQLVIATAVGFIVQKLVEKGYLKLWSRKRG